MVHQVLLRRAFRRRRVNAKLCVDSVVTTRNGNGWLTFFKHCTTHSSVTELNYIMMSGQGKE